MRGLVLWRVEVRKRAARQPPVGGAVVAAVNAVLAGTQLMVHADTHLVRVSKRQWRVERRSDIRYPVRRGAPHVDSRGWASDVANIGGRVRGRSEVLHHVCSDRIGTGPEHEVAELRGPYCVRSDGGASLPQPFIGDEEESAVANDGTAAGEIKQVLADRRQRARIENPARRQSVVHEIVGAHSVKLVGSRFAEHLYLRAGIASVHRREVVGHHADFFHRFRVGHNITDSITSLAVRAGVVQGVVVSFKALSAGEHGRLRFAGK